MVTKEKDEELALFLQMRRRELDKDRNNLLLLQNSNSNQLDASSETDNNHGSSLASNTVSSMPPRKTRADEFLNSENEKSDYDWLLTPPSTPLFPSVEKDSQKTVLSQIEIPNARSTGLKSRPANIKAEPALRNKIAPKQPTLQSGLNSSSNGNRRPSSTGGLTSASCRSLTPTGRPTLSSTTKPSRSSTPTSRANLPSTKPAAPPVRSSTPTRSTARSSTPTARPSLPASKSTSRSATPNHRPLTPSSAPSLSAPPGRSSSVPKSGPSISKKPVASRGISPTVKSRPWKPSEMSGFSLDAPPNLKTSLPERPASASRGRSGAPSAKSSSVDSAGSNGKPRQNSCSPSRGRASRGSAYSNGNSILAKSRSRGNDSDTVNPVLMGTKMVERVVNMRKLAPPKKDDTHSLSAESSGFGRSLSKKSLDMAMRHMDIRRSISGSVRPLVTSIPASSMYSVRSTSTKSRTVSFSDSPLATSSNASSEPSVNNNSLNLDGSEIGDNDFGSERGNSSPSGQHCR